MSVKKENRSDRIELTKTGALLDVYLADGTPKGAVVICPGGGYSFVSTREAGPVANAFGEAGYHAFVLIYQPEEERRPLQDKPLEELSEAMACVKSRKAAYGLEGKRIYVCGFSAGAHLAGSLGLLWNDASRFPKGTDLELHRPDAMILCYPVVSAGEYAHRGSFENLAGPDIQEQQRYSLENLVTPGAVPAFLWHTATDEIVPVQNSFLLADALIKEGIPVEMHIFPYGVHGLSLATKEVEEPEKGRMEDAHVAQWIGLCVRWMQYLEGHKPVQIDSNRP